ncbi:Vesicular integral-membrane protein VIP36 [Spathaspora sp. JA1]|nr:Vesicular integral-membrane protein VIP36 [Spathaspora sp. JA1]
MSIVGSIKRSKAVRFILILLALILIFILFILPNFSNDIFTPEEINNLLQNKRSHIVALKKQELRGQGLRRPYLDNTHFKVKYWDLKGNTMVKNNEYIRLTSTNPHLASNMFAHQPFQAESFEMELTFHIHNEKASRGLVGDGLAIWFLDKPSDIGKVFGIQNEFNGLGIMLDTYKNGKRGQFPYVNLMLGDGHTSYNKATDGYETRLAGCVAKNLLNPSSGSTKMRIVYIRDGYLSIDFNYFGRHEEWMNCVTLTDVQLPQVKYLGLSANTGQLFENVDIIENRIYALFKPDGKYVQSLDELQELIAAQEQYEEDIDKVANVMKEEKIINKKRTNTKDLGKQKRKSLQRLKNSEKRIKDRERQLRLEKYGDADATLMVRLRRKFVSTVKYTIYGFISIILVWFAWIIIRMQRQKRRVKTTGLLD